MGGGVVHVSAKLEEGGRFRSVSEGVQVPPRLIAGPIFDLRMSWFLKGDLENGCLGRILGPYAFNFQCLNVFGLGLWSPA